VSQQHGRNLDQAIATTESSLQEAIKELRTFSYLMHPLALQQRGLYNTLAAYVGGFADRSGLLCKVRMDRKHAKYPPLVQRTILRIVQEGLANAYRHASASRVSIDVRDLGARLHIVVADDGQGISSVLSPSQRPSRAGVGIRGIRMRLTQLGGRLRISAPRKGGTRLHAVLPTDKID
jgi:signal transduction histidine kinase